MSDKPFKFKQFHVLQNHCAMKVGTDAVLLGCWTNIQPHLHSVLDIGAGTGILALMLAQRCDAPQVDALEIDNKAYEQCVTNFENSPWNNRLFCYHASLQEYTAEIDEKYDLIIANPPFHSEEYKSKEVQRDLARSADALPFRHLVESVSVLLSEQGRFSVVIPFSQEKDFIVLATKERLFPAQILRVQGSPSSKIVRSLIEFSFVKTEVIIEKLIIETSRHQYTQEYIDLTKDFYLKM